MSPSERGSCAVAVVIAWTNCPGCALRKRLHDATDLIWKTARLEGFLRRVVEDRPVGRVFLDPRT